MQLIGFILAGAVGLAALRLATSLVLAVLALVVVWQLIANPKDTFCCILIFVALGLIAQYPIAGLAVFGLVALAGLLSPRS